MPRSDGGHQEDAARMRAVRDRLLKATAVHEAECPGAGQPCWRNRCGAIAFLCHSLGLRGDHVWAEIRREAEGYDRRCPHQGDTCDA